MGEILIYNAKWYKTYTDRFNNLALILLVQLYKYTHLLSLQEILHARLFSHVLVIIVKLLLAKVLITLQKILDLFKLKLFQTL